MDHLLQKVKSFVHPYYEEKDIMHDLSHIERIKIVLDELSEKTELDFNKQLSEIALYFHGIIYSHEKAIKSFLIEAKVSTEEVDRIVEIAWESQKESKPESNEGLLLHDAHMLEGGRNFEIIKSLITGSLRGQTLNETMDYIEQTLLNKGKCYTKVGVEMYEEMKARTLEIFTELNSGIGRNLR